MTSSMLNGERRWASARRGGMTVLGKVAVPKPINLPSQRLENHGLDPNVDIVPKGTHSWGSRLSPSTTNPWASSNTSSPNNDGTGSPSYLRGRPSSGESGTRPSTAGSDRAQEPNTNAWGSNSRPSSASGTLTSSQSSLASLRPRSAETRPGSSQLSRFAEPSSDSSVAWGANRTAEKLGMTSSGNDGFSLTTGDFPTLGSEKETSGKSIESQVADDGSPGRPRSSSGGAVLAKEMTGNFVGSDDGNSNIRNEISNSRRRENHMCSEDGMRNSAEKWHRDHQPYPNSNIPHQQYDAWRGPPVNGHPGGVWYRGPTPPGGPPFGSPIGPGGFPMEPFPYYRPQIPPGALTNPPPGGPRGPRPKNGDMYRPHMPDAYMRPGVPIRPGFYPGPLPYDGYYGPPMGYCNSNERDIPFMGMAMGPAAYNPYSGQNVPNPGNYHGRAHGPSSKGVVSEKMESGHPQDARGPYKVLLKQHDGREGRDEQKWDENAAVQYPGKGDHRKKSSWENGGRGHHREVEMDTRRMAIHEEGFSESYDNRGGDTSKLPEDAGRLRASDDSSVKDKEQLEPVVLPSKASPVPREPSLIQKIEGLNAKARASDGRQDVLSACGREEQKKKILAKDGKRNASVSEAAAVSESYGNPDLNTSSNEGGISTGGKSVDSMVFGGATTSRKSTHGILGGADRRGKGRFNAQESDGWRKIPQAKEPPILVSPPVHIESFQGIDSASAGTIAKPGAHSQLKNGEPLPPVSDTSDSHSQRARMTELVKQRFKQREKEEEEREREQRAKAQAKLEELNKRTLAGEVSFQKQETAPNSADGKKREESSAHVQHSVVDSKPKGHSSVLGPSPSAVTQSNESGVKGAKMSTSLSRNVLQGTTNTVHKEVHCNSVPVQQEANNSSSVHHENDPHANDIGASKQKRYMQKQHFSMEKNSSEKSTASATELSKGDASVVANTAVSPESVVHYNLLNCESSLPVNQGVITDSSLHHKRKNRNGRTKHKVEEATSNASLPSKDASASDIMVESKKATNAKLTQDHGPVQATIDSKDACLPSDQGSILPDEEDHSKENNQRKSQHPRKPLRNSHSGKSSEKFQNTDAVFWAPVRSLKSEVSDEANERPADVVSPCEKNEQQVPNNQRNKRAEMERYVPKPAVKETSQQGSSHQSVTSNNQTMANETIEKSESGHLGTESSRTSSPDAGKVGSTVEYRHGDGPGRQSKSGKALGAWRQRATTDSSTATLNTNRNVQKPSENNQHQKPDLGSVKEQSRQTDDWGFSNGSNIPENSDAPVNAPVSKEQGMVVKGKRYKATGYSHPGEKRVNSGSSEKVSVQHMSVPEMNRSQIHATSKENRSVVDRSTSHWQPKASAFVVTNEQGSRSNDDRDVIAEVSTGNKKAATSRGGLSSPPQQNKESTVPNESQHHQDGNAEEAQGVAHQEPKRGRKIDVRDWGPVSPVDPSSSNMGGWHEQRGSSGFSKNGNQNSRFGRDHEHTVDRSGLAKDGKQHNASAQRGQRQSSPHEYQPAGPDNSKTDSTVPTKDGSRNSYGRYKERGQAHPRRGGGNFNGKRTGNVGADASYE